MTETGACEALDGGHAVAGEILTIVAVAGLGAALALIAIVALFSFASSLDEPPKHGQRGYEGEGWE